MYTRAHTTIYATHVLFPKVASPSQCASLWRDVRHARVLWPCWHTFRTFSPAIPYGTLPCGSRNLYKLLPIYSSSIWHKAFYPPRNLTKSPNSQDIRMYISGSTPIMTYRYTNWPSFTGIRATAHAHSAISWNLFHAALISGNCVHMANMLCTYMCVSLFYPKFTHMSVTETCLTRVFAGNHSDVYFVKNGWLNQQRLYGMDK